MGVGKKNRVSTSGNEGLLTQDPFAALNATGLPMGRTETTEPKSRGRRKGPTVRGRVDVRRETAGRGGRTVTVISGFRNISAPELEELIREMQRACATGGTLKKGVMELQGDRCERVMDLLRKKGFRPVRTGG